MLGKATKEWLSKTVFGSLFWKHESKMELLVHSKRSRSETAIGRSLVLGMVWFGGSVYSLIIEV